MSRLVDEIKKYPQIFHSSRGKMVRVWEAEETLGLVFPEEYEAYLCHFGAIGFGGVEWTGINVDPELNVVRATRLARETIPGIPADCFVLRVRDGAGRPVLCDGAEHIFAYAGTEGSVDASGKPDAGQSSGEPGAGQSSGKPGAGQLSVNPRAEQTSAEEDSDSRFIPICEGLAAYFARCIAEAGLA